MAYKIRLTLRHSEPPVTRTVVIDPLTDAGESALVFITAMGWEGGRDHCYTTYGDDGQIEVISPGEESDLTLADLLEMRADLIYDICTEWCVDLDLLGETEEEGPKVLDYHGECPNQILSGNRDFCRICEAAADPSDPYHDQAMAWLGTVPPYDINEINERLECGYFVKGFRHRGLRHIGQPLDAILDAAKIINESGAVDKLTFRCPQCGAVCDGRRNLDLAPGLIRGMDEYPATIICPKCGMRDNLALKNDGFRIGYHDSISTKPHDQQTALYDMIALGKEPRDLFEEAEYQAELGMLYSKYDCRLENSAEIRDCLAGLDPNDGRYPRTSALCRESLTIQSTDICSGIGDADISGFEGVPGAKALSALCIRMMNGSEEDLRTLIPRTIELAESEKEADLADRCLVAGHIVRVAGVVGDRAAVEWASSVLKDAAAEAEESPESLESVGWLNLCYLSENLISELYEEGEWTEAENLMQCMAGPFVDAWCDDMPPSVRNITAFKRGLLTLTVGDDKKRALKDLESVYESIRKNEDNGPYTMRRLPYVSILRYRYGATKGGQKDGEREASVRLMVEMYHARTISPGELNRVVGDILSAHLGKGYTANRARVEFDRCGYVLEDISGIKEFSIGALWDSTLTWKMLP